MRESRCQCICGCPNPLWTSETPQILLCSLEDADGCEILNWRKDRAHGLAKSS